MQRKLQKATLHDKKMKIRSRQTANCDVQQKPKIMPPPSKEQVEKKDGDLWARDLPCIPVRLTVSYGKKGKG